MKLNDDYELIDRRNMRALAENGIHDGSVKAYRCVVCGEAVSLGESHSDLGHNLICRHCAYDNGLLGPDMRVLDFVRDGLEETE